VDGVIGGVGSAPWQRIVSAAMIALNISIRNARVVHQGNDRDSLVAAVGLNVQNAVQ